MWVEPAHAPEELAAGRLGEPLCGEDQGHVFPGISELGQKRERLVRRAYTDDPVAACIAVAQFPFDAAQGVGVGVDG